MTVSVCPNEESPAVSAKGTVRPSAKPRVKSARKRERDGRGCHVEEEEEQEGEAWRCAGFKGSVGESSPSCSLSEKFRPEVDVVREVVVSR